MATILAPPVSLKCPEDLCFSPPLHQVSISKVASSGPRSSDSSPSSCRYSLILLMFSKSSILAHSPKSWFS